MPRRDHQPAVGEYYHVFNRGVEKREVFLDDRDYQRFLSILPYYLNPNPPISYSQRDRIQIQELDVGEALVEVVAYCLMPNHFHLLAKVVQENGLETWIRRAASSYSHAFNQRYTRVGSLFQGPYKAVHIATNEQLLHVSRYIHLNPVVAGLCGQAEEHPYSSMRQYLTPTHKSWINPDSVLGQFPAPEDYRSFVANHASFATELHQIKHLLIEEE